MAKAKDKTEIIDRAVLATCMKMHERNLMRVLDAVKIKPHSYHPETYHALYDVCECAKAFRAKVDFIRAIVAGKDEALDLYECAQRLGITGRTLNLIIATTGEPKPAAQWLQYGRAWSRNDIDKLEAVHVPLKGDKPNTVREKTT